MHSGKICHITVELGHKTPETGRVSATSSQPLIRDQSRSIFLCRHQNRDRDKAIIIILYYINNTILYYTINKFVQYFSISI